MRASLLLLLAASGCGLILGIPGEGQLESPASDAAIMPPDSALPIDDAGLPIEGTSMVLHQVVAPPQLDTDVDAMPVDGAVQIVLDEQPEDLSETVIAAVVPTPMGFETYAGSGTAAGTFRIPDARVTPRFYLSWTVPGQAPDLYDVAARTLDMGFASPGRVTAPGLNALGTSLKIDGSGMSPPWDFGEINLFVPNLNLILTSWVTPAAAATTLSGTGDWRPYALVDGAARDRVYLLYRRGAELVQILAVLPFTMTNGAQAMVSEIFHGIANPQSVTLTLRGAQWQAVIDATNPSLTIHHIFVTLAQHPDTEHGITFVTPALLDFFHDDFSADMPLSGMLRLPFRGWAPIVRYELELARPYQLPTATATLVNASSTGEVSFPGGNIDLVPLIGVASNVQLDGAAIATDATVALAPGVGPMLTWTAPAFGPASSYRVTVTRLRIISGNTSQETIARFHTPMTSLAIPRSMLVVGDRYVFKVTSILDARPAARLRGRSLPHAESTFLSGLITIMGS